MFVILGASPRQLQNSQASCLSFTELAFLYFDISAEIRFRESLFFFANR